LTIDVNDLSTPFLVLVNKILPLPLLNPLVARLAPTAAPHAIAIHAHIVRLLNLGAEQVLAGLTAKETVEDVTSAVRTGDIAVVWQKLALLS
jgi:hypothetical protein